MKKVISLTVMSILAISIMIGCDKVKYDDIKVNPYNKEIDTLYVTWINVWAGSTEFWWKDYTMENPLNGTLIKVNDEFVIMDNNNKEHRKAIFNSAKEAGMECLVMDLTNGYSAWQAISLDYQKMCSENDMYFAAAVHPTDSKNLEEICKFVNSTYMKGKYGNAYFNKNGKPLLVLYCTPEEFAKSTQGEQGTYTQMFEFVWASGENSKEDKWGWQLEPFVGPVNSKDSMFITPSLAWNTPNIHQRAWRKSLSWLDFCFLAQREAQPAYSIVSSIDDIFERNGWLIADTTKAKFSFKEDTVNPGLQMRNVFGDIDFEVYYNRVKAWTAGGADAFVGGGIIPDGAYTITGVDSGKMFGVKRPAPGQADDIDEIFYSNKYLESDTEKYYWFYHLGDNEYRIVKLTSGLSLTAQDDGTLIQTWQSDDESQFWRVQKNEDGSYSFVNKKTGKSITDSKSDNGKITVTKSTEKWILEAVKNRQIIK